MRYYVSCKTTGYYRKDSLKLVARCLVSGCWPSCLRLRHVVVIRLILVISLLMSYANLTTCTMGESVVATCNQRLYLLAQL